MISAIFLQKNVEVVFNHPNIYYRTFDTTIAFVVVARFPVGWTFNITGNSGGRFEYLSPREGTGNWETYVAVAQADASGGVLMNAGHMYITNTNNSTNATNPSMDIAYEQAYYTSRQSDTAGVNKFKIGATDETLTAVWRAVDQTVKITPNNSNGNYKVTATNLFDKTDMLTSNAKIIKKSSPTYNGASKLQEDSTHTVSGWIRVVPGATYKITGATEAGMVEWSTETKAAKSYFYKAATQATSYSNNTTFQAPTTYIDTSGNTVNADYLYMRFHFKTSDINNIKLEMTDSNSYTDTQTLYFPNNASIAIVATPNTGYNAAVSKSSGLGTLTSTTSNDVVTANLSNIAGNKTTTNLAVTFTGKIYSVTLNNQGATTAGTTKVWYQFYTSKKIDGVTVYYYSDSQCTTPITSGKIITKPTKTGYTFKGYYTGQNGTGTQYVNANGNFINNIYRTVANDSTLYAYWERPVYEIALNNQGATTPGTDKIYLTYSTKYSLTQNGNEMTTSANPITIPTKTGYAFLGYYTTAETDGTQYINNEGYKTDSADLTGFTANGTLYARWEKVTLRKSETSTSSTTAKFLYTTIERRKIKNISFATSISGHTVDGNTCFDVSSLENAGQVLLWITNIDENGYYEIVIGQEGGVIANPDSSYLLSYVGYSTPSFIINVNNFDTSNANNMEYMFKRCGYTGMTSLNLGNKFDTSNVTNMGSMFQYCGSKLISLNLGNKFDTLKVTNMAAMFQYCGNISMTSLDLGDKFDTSNVTDMCYMFDGCGSVGMTSLDLGDNFDTSNVTNMRNMFSSCGTTSIELGDKFDTSNVTNMAAMFDNCDVDSLDLGDKFDTSNVTDMSYMFNRCGYTTMISLDLGEKFNTSNVTNMSYMFDSCGLKAMTSLNLGDKFDTSKVTDMSSMFAECGRIAMTSLNLGDKFDTSKVTNMISMFTYCGYNAMTSLNLGNKFDISSVTSSLGGMFDRCGNNSMITLDLGDSFDVTKTNASLGGIFSNCGNNALTHIDLSGSTFNGNINTQTNLYGMFNNLKNNVTVYVKDQTAKDFLINYKSQMSCGIPNNNFVIGSM